MLEPLPGTEPPIRTARAGSLVVNCVKARLECPGQYETAIYHDVGVGSHLHVQVPWRPWALHMPDDGDVI